MDSFRSYDSVKYFVVLAFFLLATQVCFAIQPADLVILNANIRTMDRKKPRAEALAVKDGKFVAVGTNREIRAFVGPQTKRIDANGKLVLPGFNDAHVHFAAIGNKFSTIDLKRAKTLDEVAAMLAEYAAVLPKGRWILGGGFDPAMVKNGLRSKIDSVTSNNPVFVYTADGKSAFANSAALEKAKAVDETSGLISGVELQNIAAVVPKDHTKNWPEILETATNYAASLGVTSVQDMHSDELADVYRELERQGKLKTRVYDCSPITAWKKLAEQGIKAASGDARVRTGCVKYFSDGEEDAAPEIEREIAAADKAGLQVMVHAIGPNANSIVLNAFEKAIKQNGPRDRRFRVEHAQNVAADDLPRFGRSKIIASMQPWLFNGTNPAIYKRHLQLGTMLAFGSDAAIKDFNPLLGIYAATTGTDAMGIDEAIYAYTVGSAYAEFQEKVKGTITVGMLADFVVIDQDFLSQPRKIKSAKVAATFVGGVQVYASK